MVSPAAAVTAIVMMRWGPFAAIHAALSGALYCWLSGGGVPQLLVYAIGNLAAMAALLFFRRYKKEEIRLSTWLTLAYGGCIQLLMLAGRALVALLCGMGTEAALGLVTTDVLSLVFTLVILWIVRRVDGLFEDQKHYLFRVQREPEDVPAIEEEETELTMDDQSGKGRQQ